MTLDRDSQGLRKRKASMRKCWNTWQKWMRRGSLTVGCRQGPKGSTSIPSRWSGGPQKGRKGAHIAHYHMGNLTVPRLDAANSTQRRAVQVTFSDVLLQNFCSHEFAISLRANRNRLYALFLVLRPSLLCSPPL